MRSQHRCERRIFIIGAVHVPEEGAREEFGIFRVHILIHGDLHQAGIALLLDGAKSEVAEAAGEAAMLVVGERHIADDQHAALDQQILDRIAVPSAQQFVLVDLQFRADPRFELDRLQSDFRGCSHVLQILTQLSFHGN